MSHITRGRHLQRMRSTASLLPQSYHPALLGSQSRTARATSEHSYKHLQTLANLPYDLASIGFGDHQAGHRSLKLSSRSSEQTSRYSPRCSPKSFAWHSWPQCCRCVYAYLDETYFGRPLTACYRLASQVIGPRCTEPSSIACTTTVNIQPAVDLDCTFYSSTVTETTSVNCSGCALTTNYLGHGLVSRQIS